MALAASIAGVPGCDSAVPPGPAPSSAAPPITAIRIDGPETVPPGAEAIFSAAGTRADGATKDATAAAQWRVDTGTTYCPGATGPEGTAVHFTSPGVLRSNCRGRAWISAQIDGVKTTRHLYVLEPGTYAVTGTVFEAQADPLGSARVEILAGTGSGLSAETDYKGQYGLYGVAGPVTIRVTRDHFQTTTTHTVVTDHSTVDLAIAPIVAPFDVSGAWTMTLQASTECRGRLPEIARDRSYDVTIEQHGSQLRAILRRATLSWGGRTGSAESDAGTVVDRAMELDFYGDTDYGTFSIPSLYDTLDGGGKLGWDGVMAGLAALNSFDLRMTGDVMYWAPGAPGFAPTHVCRAADHVVTFRR